MKDGIILRKILETILSTFHSLTFVSLIPSSSLSLSLSPPIALMFEEVLELSPKSIPNCCYLKFCRCNLLKASIYTKLAPFASMDEVTLACIYEHLMRCYVIVFLIYSVIFLLIHSLEFYCEMRAA